MAEPTPRIARFNLAERLLHWLLAVAFGVLLVTGLLMAVPALAGTVPRPEAKSWHIDAAIGLAVGVVLITAARARALWATASDLDRFDADDRRWLAGIPRRIVTGAPAPPQGRFNAGQKLNTAVVAGLMVVSYITGVLLWFGEQNTLYRFAGTIDVHDDVMWLLIVLVAGHLYMALINPATQPALRGIVTGDVDRRWARAHHAKWVAAAERGEASDTAPHGVRATDEASGPV